jgi:hypothetical protein
LDGRRVGGAAGRREQNCDPPTSCVIEAARFNTQRSPVEKLYDDKQEQRATSNESQATSDDRQ